MLATLLLVIGGCGGDAEPSSGASASSASPSAGDVIRYGKDGVTIKGASDVSKLEGAPEDFKAFIAGLIEDVEIDKDCPDKPAYSVDALDPAGYAAGGFGYCGGNYIIWAKVAGQWREVLGGQDHPMCHDLNRWGIPREILIGDSIGDTCFDEETREVPYRP